MILSCLLAGAGLLAFAAPLGTSAQSQPGPVVAAGQVGAKVDLTVPGLYLEGEAFVATVSVVAPANEPLEIPAWAFTGAAFTLGKKQLGTRNVTEKVRLAPGQTFMTTVDLGPMIEEQELEPRNLEIGWNGLPDVPKQTVVWLEAAEKGIEFMELPAEQLDDYQIALQTNQGLIWLDLWPDVAPNHVRNFLDLAYTGFYDGTGFHRVIAGFMIQGGNAREGETAPRKLDAEFSTKRHYRGVLSAARLPNDVNSATSGFFIVHAENAGLDGKYTVFGEMLFGYEALDAIAATADTRFSPNTPKGYTPTSPQTIGRAVVVKASEPAAAGERR